MTNSEAINFLKGYLDEEVYTEKCRNAHKMAIKALEQEPALDKIRAEIEQVSFTHNFEYGEYYGEDTREERIVNLDAVMQIIDKYKSESKVIERNLCDSCTNKGCIFQYGIVRSHCDFYKAESEDKE